MDSNSISSREIGIFGGCSEGISEPAPGARRFAGLVAGLNGDGR